MTFTKFSLAPVDILYASIFGNDETTTTSHFGGMQTSRVVFFNSTGLQLDFSPDMGGFLGFDLAVELVQKPDNSCYVGSFLCPQDHYCVAQSKVCDGVVDCSGGDDELTFECQMKKNETVCGLPKIESNLYLPSNIINGTEAKPGSWPWTVALFRKKDDEDEQQFCGATLVTPRWLVSAAHCFHGYVVFLTWAWGTPHFRIRYLEL